MIKTRVLSRDLGEADDLMYYGNSFSANYPSALTDPKYKDYFTEQITKPYYEGMGNRNNTLVYPTNIAGMEVMDSSENRRPQFNNCVHSKSKLINYAYAYMQMAFNSTRVCYGAPYIRAAPHVSSLTPWDGLSASFGDYESSSRRAYWEMQPRFEGQVSMLNFLFELKDFRDLAKHMLKLRSVSSVGGELRKLRSRFKSAKGKFYPKDAPTSVMNNIYRTGFSVSKIAAEIRLTNEFALKPLISDWLNILRQAGQMVDEVQETFKDKGLDSQSRHYSEEFIVQDNLTPGIYNSYYTSSGTFEKDVFTATWEYKYNYSMRPSSIAFRKYWGLQFTPEVIWNAIPFSFLVDYFTKVGNSIHSMSVDPAVKMLPTQYCESVLRSYSSGVSVTGDPRAFMTVNGKYPMHRGDCIAGLTGSHYQRRVCLPNKGSALPRIQLPSGRQGANMAALAICFL